MAIEAHLQSLNERHRKLDDAISSETKRPGSDETRITFMKRLKLKLKDQIAELKKSSD